MEKNNRDFEAVEIGLTSVETGKERFTTDDHYFGPPVSGWRCNLTALSQRYNLYFVAAQDGVCVYEPEFPFQKLKSTPKLYIPPSLAKQDAHGYIDDRRPHCINHLIVGDLGTDEVLLLATDSGNVTAYHTKVIRDAVQKDPFKFSADGRSDYVGVRPFFAHWVHESAWGLAMHREGRMIAVSANKPYHFPVPDPSAKITVFAFALTEPSSDTDTDSEDTEEGMEGEEDDWFDWDPSEHDGTSPTRDRNYKITLAGVDGHTNNIPSISFVNSSEDTAGSWLLSTDINGGMKTWQIWRGRCYVSHNFDETLRSRAWPWRRDGGWVVAALDPSAFRHSVTMEQFCGHHRAPRYFAHPGESYDITNIARLRTPGRSHRHPLVEGQSDDDGNQLDNEDAAEEWSSEDLDTSEQEGQPSFDMRHLSIHDSSQPESDSLPHSSRASDNEAGAEEQDPSPQLSLSSAEQHAAALNEEIDVEDLLLDHYEQVMSQGDLETDIHFNETGDIETADEQFHDAEDNDSAISSSSSASTTSETSLDVETTLDPILSPNTSSDASGSSSQRTRSSPPKRSRSERAGAGLDGSRLPHVPTVHCSFAHLRLIDVLHSRSPHVFCANILNQELPPQLEAAHEYHLIRLSMLQSISELGIVIVASQLGRVAICSLTRHPSTNTLGLRVDWVLPTRKQEKSNLRPPSPLLGIATSPIQGRQFTESAESSDSETWGKDCTVSGVETTFDNRILLFSSDHATVEDYDSDTNDVPKHRAPKRKKRQKSFSSHGSNTSTNASTETRRWAKPKQREEWQAVESSRRYRLMLTYLNQTVLTYEIGRGVERHDMRSNSVAQ